MKIMLRKIYINGTYSGIGGSAYPCFLPDLGRFTVSYPEGPKCFQYPKRMGRDSNPRYGDYPYTAFPVLLLRPLGHPSNCNEILGIEKCGFRFQTYLNNHIFLSTLQDINPAYYPLSRRTWRILLLYKPSNPKV